MIRSSQSFVQLKPNCRVQHWWVAGADLHLFALTSQEMNSTPPIALWNDFQYKCKVTDWYTKQMSENGFHGNYQLLWWADIKRSLSHTLTKNIYILYHIHRDLIKENDKVTLIIIHMTKVLNSNLFIHIQSIGYSYDKLWPTGFIYEHIVITSRQVTHFVTKVVWRPAIQLLAWKVSFFMYATHISSSIRCKPISYMY